MLTEKEKGRFISIFWIIFNAGGVVGGAVSLAENFHSEVRSPFFSETYSIAQDGLNVGRERCVSADKWIVNCVSRASVSE